MDNTTNALNWFEIPVEDLERAQKFYEGIFDMKMMPLPEMMGMKMVAFPGDPMSGKVSGALAKSDFHQTGMEGILIYLNADPSINAVVDRIEEFGGEITMPTMQISPEIGYMAIFNDTEGNRVGLHAQK